MQNKLGISPSEENKKNNVGAMRRESMQIVNKLMGKVVSKEMDKFYSQPQSQVSMISL